MRWTMTVRGLRMAGFAAGLGCLLFGGLGAAAAQQASAVAKLDLRRFVGSWYEVARYPNRAEKHCANDAVRLYALGDKPGRIQVVTTCRTKEGYADVRNMNGRTADKNGDGKLKVTSIWPFSTPFWVLAVGPQYEWALLGNPNHKLLWVLSRTPTMTPEVLAEAEAKASAEGYDRGKLVMVLQPSSHEQ